MRKRLFPLIMIVALAACKKNNAGDPPNPYHITANVGGADKSFSLAAIAFKWTNGPMTMLSISGAAASGNKEILGISIQNVNGRPITPGTYMDTSVTFPVSCTYSLNTTGLFAGGSSVIFSPGYSVRNHVSIVIDSIDSATVKGTFSGDVYQAGDITKPSIPVTHGVFYVKIKQ